MEHRCSGSDEANPRPGSHPMPPGEGGARRTASLWTRQMVSRRAVAALGAELLLARRLQVSFENVLPAYNGEAESAEVAGYILPIRRRQSEGRLCWSSQLWFRRPERLLLSPGDSPVGYRIPTESMPWVAPDELEYAYEAAPFADLIKLPSRPIRRMDLFQKNPVADPLPARSATAEAAPELIRPALCVQARESRLHVFLPYASKLADYLDLVAAVEDTRSEERRVGK